MKNSLFYSDKYIPDNNIFLNQFKFNILMKTLVNNTFTLNILGLHVSSIQSETLLLFQAMSPEQKQTTLYVQIPNCTQLCHEAQASQCTLSWDQPCKAACSAFSYPLLITEVWECLCANVCVRACLYGCGGVYVCVCRKSKILQHHSLQLVVDWKQARAPAPQVDQTLLSRHCGKLGGHRNMETHLSPRHSVKLMDCEWNFLKLCSPL